MAKRSVSPIMTWAFWGIVVLGALLTVTWEFFISGFAADTSKITWLIFVFFIYGLIASALVAFHLQSEYKALKLMEQNQKIVAPESSDIAELFNSAVEQIRQGNRIETRNLISSYGSRLNSRVYNLSVLSNMLITIGLLGTVVGLIMTVTGLGQVLQASGADFAEIKAGMNDTVAGMGTAFYTTFFGALLGGVVLKVLSAEMKKSAAVLVADCLRFSELFITPQVQRRASQALSEFEERVGGLHSQLGDLSRSFGEAVEMLDSKQSALAGGLEHLVDTVGRTSEQASERTGELLQTLSGSLEQTSLQADERLQLFKTTMEQHNLESSNKANALIEAISTSSETMGRSMTETSGHAAQQLEAVSSAVQTNMEETNRRVNEQMEAMLAKLDEMVSSADQKASDRLEVLTEAIARNTSETNRLADERLQILVRTVEQATQIANEKADLQMAGMVQNVEQSMERSRKDAEERLTTRAADLAAKMNEAATMLSGLVNQTDAAGQSNEE